MTIAPIVGFEWDDGNRGKCQKHGVSIAEIETVLMPGGGSLVSSDLSHSATEARFIAVGKTATGRGVFIIFTMRQHGAERFIRPVSARYMHRKEVESYEKEIARTPQR